MATAGVIELKITGAQTFKAAFDKMAEEMKRTAKSFGRFSNPLPAMDDEGRLIISPYSPPPPTWTCDYCGLVRPDSLTHCWDGWQGCGADRPGKEEAKPGQLPAWAWPRD